MKPAVIFALAVRLLGLWFLHGAVSTLAAVFFTRASDHTLFGVIIQGGAAVWCLFGGEPIQSWAYPEENKTQPPLVGASPIGSPTRACVSCGKPIPVDAKFCPHCAATQPN